MCRGQTNDVSLPREIANIKSDNNVSLQSEIANIKSVIEQFIELTNNINDGIIPIIENLTKTIRPNEDFCIEVKILNYVIKLLDVEYVDLEKNYKAIETLKQLNDSIA